MLIQQADAQLDPATLPALAAWTLEQTRVIQQIPAPTFDEGERAARIASIMREIGLADVAVDGLHNVTGRIRGARQAGLLISAHSDTVFSRDVSLAIRQDGDLLYGPGIGDNSLGVAGLLAAARVLAQGDPPPCDVWFASPSREEGLGDLGGMRAVCDTLGSAVRCVINLEGSALGYIYPAGIAVRRLHITAQAPGGHSWLHFGRPSAVHELMRLGALIASIRVPQEPRTTYNIGIIEGGTTINAIAAEAGLWLDLRSEDTAQVELLERQVRRLAQRLARPELTFRFELVGNRPAGQISPDHWLVELAAGALNQIGVRPALEAGSTDANIPLSRGCPAVTIGVSRGGNAHRLDEYIETQPIAGGLRQILTLIRSTLAHLEQEPDDA